MEPKQYPSRPFIGNHLVVALFLIAALSTHAEAASVPSNNTTDDTSPNNSTRPIGSSLGNYAIKIQKEMACYALPYGAIGTISHILTFYSSWCWAAGRAPLRPWTPMHMVKLDTAIFVVAFIVTFSLSVTTMVRCKGTSELLCVAAWKLFLGITAFAMEMFGVWLGRRGEKEEDYDDYDDFRYMPRARRYLGRSQSLVSVWTVFMVPYMISSIVGLSGLATAVFNYQDSAQYNSRDLTPAIPEWLFAWTIASIVIMGCIILGFLLVFFSLLDDSMNAMLWRGLKGLVITMVVLNSIYSDWGLAFLANDKIGQGGGKTGQALTWVYFFAKRLPMLSF